MKIEFADPRLALIQTAQAHKLGLPLAVIKSCRKKLLMIEAATTDLTLKNMNSLDFKELGNGVCQIRLNDQYRMRFQLDLTTKPEPTVTVIFIGDPH